MEWVWVITAAITICVLFVIQRLIFIRGYKAGASKVLAEWRLSLEEEFNNDGDA